MKNFFLAVLVVFISVTGAHAAALPSSDKIAMQAAMQQYIERQLVDGQYLDLNLDNGDVRPLVPGKNHPMILRMGEYFVLCTDFKTLDGKSVNIDFYLARRDDSFFVFRAPVNNRAPLAALMRAGKATRVD